MDTTAEVKPCTFGLLYTKCMLQFIFVDFRPFGTLCGLFQQLGKNSPNLIHGIPNIYIKGILSINLDPTKLKKGPKNIKKIQIYPKKSKAMNLAFDVTPAKYITGWIPPWGAIIALIACKKIKV